MPNPAPRPPDAPLSQLPSGWADLDRVLGGGWPPGELTELVGHGCASLALAAVRQAQSAGQPAAWVDGPGGFCPATAGVDLVRLTLVRPPLAPPPAREVRKARRRGPCSAALLAADLLLRSRAFGLLVLDLPLRDGRGTPPALAAWFRLARQASRAQSVLLLLGDAERPVAGSAAGLTLRAAWRHPAAAAWELLPPPALEVAVLRHRGDPLARTVVLS